MYLVCAVAHGQLGTSPYCKPKVALLARNRSGLALSPFRSKLIDPPIHEIWLSPRSWIRLKVKVSQWVQQLIDSHPFLYMSIVTPIMGYGYFTTWPWKYKDKIIAQDHIVSWTSCHSIPSPPNLHLDTAFLNLTLKILGQVPGWGQGSK